MSYSDSSNRRLAVCVFTLVLSLAFAKPILAKLETVRVTITGSDLPMPLEITDKSSLTGFNIWSGPGNFKIENGVKIPIVHDGSIMWSQGTVPEPPKGLPQHEISFYGGSPEERIIYVMIYEYDPTSKKGYIYLPGKGEKWYDVNVRSIYRGVEGHWFRASEEFDHQIGAVIAAGRSAPAK